MNLHVFCDADEGSRWNLVKPWISGGYMYATDGRIAVRVKTSDKPSDDKKDLTYPHADKLFAKFGKCTKPWPAFEHEDIACRECLGKGKRLVKCKKCDGVGTTPIRRSKCKTCYGKGLVTGHDSCVFCAGTGQLTAPKGNLCNDDPAQWSVDIGVKQYDTYYLALIERELRVIHYREGNRKGFSPLRFTANDGVQGLLMGLNT